MIYIYFVERHSLMLHAEFQIHRPFGLGEDFLKNFAIYSLGSHLGHVTWIIYSLFANRLHMKFGIDWPCGFTGDV